MVNARECTTYTGSREKGVWKMSVYAPKVGFVFAGPLQSFVFVIVFQYLSLHHSNLADRRYYHHFRKLMIIITLHAWERSQVLLIHHH